MERLKRKKELKLIARERKEAMKKALQEENEAKKKRKFEKKQRKLQKLAEQEDEEKLLSETEVTDASVSKSKKEKGRETNGNF